ncbi:MAG: hypothetical protein CR988_03260 [Treponema sp.]|nr:MAG: hypothetical protein CR988_03260 [Treponema sp.]
MKRILFFIIAGFIFSTLVFSAGVQSELDKNDQSTVLLNLFDAKQKVKCIYGEKSVEIKTTAKMPYNSKLKYTLYNSEFNTVASGSLSQTPLLCPYGTQVCFWVEYEDGIKSRAKSFLITQKQEFPVIDVISPIGGIWNKPQMLKINFIDGTEIFYSVDGSDPEKRGIMYTKPVLIEKTGTVEIRIRAVTPDNQVIEKSINYRVDEPDTTNSKKTKSYDNKKNEQKAFVPYRILDWNFFEFHFQMPVHYSLSSENKTPDDFIQNHTVYDGPFFIDRTDDVYLFWSCESFKKGEIQKILLPAKPVLSGAPKQDSINKSVDLMLSDSRYSYYFETSEKFLPIEPSTESEKFEEQKKHFTVQPNEEKQFNLRIKAFYKGLSHGEFLLSFKIDKLNPPKPKILYSTPESFSNSPIKISLPKPKKDYSLMIDITPPPVEKNKYALILNGSSTGDVTYNVKAYYRDKAGNKSEVEEKVFTVGRYSVYVNPVSGNRKGTGNINRPFLSIEDALAYIQELAGKEKDPDILPVWTIYLSGKTKISEPLLVTNNVQIKGQDNAKIELADNVGFVAENCILKIANCSITRKESENEPREVPVIYASNSSVGLTDSDITSKNGGAIINLFNSHLESSNSSITSTQKHRCTVMNLNKSSAVIDSTKITAHGNSVVIISTISSKLKINSFDCVLYPKCVSRVIEGWNSKIEVSNFSCSRMPQDAFNFDTCIWYDANSSFRMTEPVSINGFKHNEQQQDNMRD